VRRSGIISPKLEGSSNGVTKSPQVSDDHGQVAAYSGHVFKQNESWPDNPNNVCCGWPHVAFVVCSFLLSCNTEGLAGESCGKHINHSRIACGVPFTNECSDIAKDWRVVEDAVLDPLREDFLAVPVPFDVADMPESEEHGAEHPAACSCEE
jgi:hypothetical protein